MPKHKAFISYSSSDKGLADRLAKALSEHGVEVLNKEAIQPGDSWSTHLKSVIENADAVVPVLSAEAGKNPEMASELSLALADKLSGGKMIIVPVLADKSAVIPFFLKDVQAADLSSKESFKNNIDGLVRAILHQTQSAPSQDTILKDRTTLLLEKWKGLKIEEVALTEKTLIHSSFIAWTLSVVSVASVVILSIISFSDKWISLNLPSFAVATLSFLAGGISSVIASIFFRRRVKRLRRSNEERE